MPLQMPQEVVLHWLQPVHQPALVEQVPFRTYVQPEHPVLEQVLQPLQGYVKVVGVTGRTGREGDWAEEGIGREERATTNSATASIRDAAGPTGVTLFCKSGIGM